jgi:hypothetical protein
MTHEHIARLRDYNGKGAQWQTQLQSLAAANRRRQIYTGKGSVAWLKRAIAERLLVVLMNKIIARLRSARLTLGCIKNTLGQSISASFQRNDQP